MSKPSARQLTRPSSKGLWILEVVACILVLYVGSYIYLVTPIAFLSVPVPGAALTPAYRQAAWCLPVWIYEPLVKLDQALFPQRWKLRIP